MNRHLVDAGPADILLLPKFVKAIAELKAAQLYAHDTGCNPWEFAVSVQRLYELGLTETDVRWLAKKRIIEHALEVTEFGAQKRQFQHNGHLTFSKRSRVILVNGVTDPLLPNCNAVKSGGSLTTNETTEIALPHWSQATRELRWKRELLKRFKCKAENQEIILNVFEEEQWPNRIDDPLPPASEMDSKRRLNDTIKCLNRNLLVPVIHFRADGTGTGVIWERI